MDSFNNLIELKAPIQKDVRCVPDLEKVQEVLVEVPGEQERAQLQDIFSALSDHSRIIILYALAKKELCVCELAEVVGVSESAISHHLRQLRDLKLVATRRQGTIMRYRILPQALREILSFSRKAINTDYL